MDSEASLAQAHLEHAVHELLTRSDPSGHALFIAIRVLDLQEALREATGPASVASSGSVTRSIEAAVRLLINAEGLVAQEVLVELHHVLVDLSDHGQR